MQDRRVALTLEQLDAAPRARQVAAAAVVEWGLAAIADDVRLVVSELVGNGMLHAGPPVELRVIDLGGAVRIEVEDRTTLSPVLPNPSTESMTGRGLALIDALSRRWGVQQLPDGKVVWCVVGPETADDNDDEPHYAGATALVGGREPSAEPVYKVLLGDVPTDLLVAAKAHIDNLIREFALASGGEASGATSTVPAELAELIETVVHRFAEARQAIKRQAIAASARGESRTQLEVALTLSAVEAGEEYLAALDLADWYARDARLLTLETPPAHRVFRHWYVGSLVDQVRRAAAGEPAPEPQTFEQRLLEELAAVADAQRASARSVRLQAVTAELSRATTAEDVAKVVVTEGVAVLGAAGGALLLPDGKGGVVVPASVGYGAQLVGRLRRQSAAAHLPAAAAIRQDQGVWLESRRTIEQAYPDLVELEPTSRALCAVPLPTPGGVRGALRFSFDQPRLFDADERAFIGALAAQAAQALERSDLYDAERAARADAEQLAARLARLQEVTTALTGARDQHEIGELVVTHVADAVGATLTTFCLLVDDSTLEVVAARGLTAAAAQQWRRFPLDADLPGSEAVRGNEPVVVSSRAELERRYPGLAGAASEDRSLVCIPVSLGERRLGVMSLSFPVEQPFDSSQLRFLTAIAHACAQAIDRAAALERAREATQKLAFLAQASSELGSTLDYRETLTRLARLVVPQLADWCSVQIVEDGELRTLAVTHVDPGKVAFAEELQRRYPPDPAAERGAPHVIRTGASELHAHVTDEQLRLAARDDEHLRLIRELGLVSGLTVPLTGRAGTFGALTLVAAESGRHYDEADLAFAEDLAARAAVAVENARAYSLQSGRLAAITRVAEAAQYAILAPMPERLGPLELAAAYVSAARDALVGGDMYEAIRQPDRVRLLVGDVRGKGLEAVRMATVVLGHFRSAAVECADLPELARQVDERLRPHLGDEDFVTALIAEIHDDGHCLVVSCGHPPAMLAQDGALTPLGADDSLPLGLGAAPQPVQVQLRPGDRLLLYTDGLLEARDSSGAFVDLDRMLVPLVAAAEPVTAVSGVLDALQEAVGGRLGDDLALVVAQYDPPAR